MARKLELCCFDVRLGAFRTSRYVHFGAGERMVREGKAEYVLDEEQNVVGFVLKSHGGVELLAPKPVNTPERFKASVMRASEATLSLHEMDLAACGRSRTLGLSKAQRLVREMRGEITEDFVELAMVKAASFRTAVAVGCAG
ncbi:hypothetical protein GOB94_13985 [Granulicella sp. 5B5]|uniref:hypothetical protein n=1 Tax=Granulicella sp. 5B5 TaxID=1617967 RepID=UPI0015F5C675|nr:hypothetical protein [Granulicella sp. 5B5]QMV19675.1 hypothetical protein GOB94_13985 [Granulicella sp. 5B5]